MGSRPARLGERTTFRIVVRNRHTQPLDDIVLRSEFSPELEHYDPDLQGPAPGSDQGVLERHLGRLEGGATYTADITFVPRRPGQPCVRVTAASVTGSATSQACIDVDAPPSDPRLTVRFEAIDAVEAPLRLGSARDYRIVVRNTGNVPLHNTQLALEMDQSLQVMRGTTGAESLPFGLRWQLGDAPGGPRASGTGRSAWQCDRQSGMSSGTRCNGRAGIGRPASLSACDRPRGPGGGGRLSAQFTIPRQLEASWIDHLASCRDGGRKSGVGIPFGVFVGARQRYIRDLRYPCQRGPLSDQ